MERLKLIAVVGDERFDTARNIFNGLKEVSGIAPVLSLSDSEYMLAARPRSNVGSAIDGFGEAHGEEHIILTSTDRIPRMDGIENCVLVLCGKYGYAFGGVKAAQHRRIYAVVNSAARLEIPKISSLTTITCGMNAKDSVTMSSVKGSSAVVCVQRQLYTFHGRIIEPCEYPMPPRVTGDIFTQLATFCVLLLCDYI